MKKAFFYITYLLLIIVACENQEQIFEDFDFRAVYFPYQLPLRTLSLGEDRVDNSLDKAFQFDIGITIGGMYKNKWDWTVNYIIDNSLTDNVFHSASGNPILPLPAEYYTLSPTNEVIIPKGLFYGTVRVQLSETFFNDPVSLTGEYVIPLKITGTSADSVLSGKPAVSNPDLRILDHWEAGMTPKNWVMYGIKFINAYQGTYLQRGKTILYEGDIPVDTIVYRAIHVEQDRIVTLTSLTKTRSITNFISRNTSSTGQYAMELEFANMWGTPGGTITISPGSEALYAVTGSGEFLDKAASSESIIGLRMQSMRLNYTYDDGTYIYKASDTLVFRDRGLKFEENFITIDVP